MNWSIQKQLPHNQEIQKVKKDAVKFIKKVPLHLRERLRRKTNAREDEIGFVLKNIPINPWDRLARKLEKIQMLEIVGEKALHQRHRKKLKEKRIARGKSAATSANSDFDPSDYINEPLIFKLKKTSKEKITDRLI